MKVNLSRTSPDSFPPSDIFIVSKSELWPLFVAGFNVGSNLGPFPGMTEPGFDMMETFDKVVKGEENYTMSCIGMTQVEAQLVGDVLDNPSLPPEQKEALTKVLRKAGYYLTSDEA